VPDFARRRRGPFLMAVEDTFSGAGSISATGRVERGEVREEDEVEIVGLGDVRRARVHAIETFRKRLDRAKAGDRVAIDLGGIERLEIGQVLAAPGTSKAGQRFPALLYALATEDGGRRLPFSSGYRPRFYFRTIDVTGTVTLPEGVDRVMPGEHVRLIVDLARPVALESGLRFAVRESGRTVGVGVVLQE
jgi:elongation factor Tu